MKKHKHGHRPRDGDHIDTRSGQAGAYRVTPARTGLLAAILTLLVILVAYAGWSSFEERLRVFFDDICCGQVIAFPLPSAELAPPAPSGDDLCRDTGSLLSFRPRNGSYPFLAAWPAERQARLEMWLDLGIRLSGDWQSEELAVTLDVLDAFGAIYGEERFADLVQQAVRQRSGGWRNYLTIARLCDSTIPAAAWAPQRGQILLNDALFDTRFLQSYYNWRVITGTTMTEANPLDLLRLVIAHEFGHAIIDGLRLEAVQDGDEMLSLEKLYTRYVPADQQPHIGAATNENVATEVGMWALGLPRTHEVEQFRVEILEKTTSDELWPQRVISVTPRSAPAR